MDNNKSFTIICDTCGNKVVIKEGKNKEDEFVYEYEDRENKIGVFNDLTKKGNVFFGCKKCGTIIGA